MAKPKTCRMCSAAQHQTPGHRPLPRMYRADDGTWQCSDAAGCLARRHDLIDAMQCALDRAWRALDAASEPLRVVPE